MIQKFKKCSEFPVLLSLLTVLLLTGGCSSQPSKLVQSTATDNPPLAQNLGEKDEYEFALGLAKLAIENKRYDKAEQILNRLRQANEEDVRVYRLLAKMYEQQGHLDLAWVAWHKAIQLDAHTIADESEYARLALLTKHYAEAEKIYQAWLDDADNDSEKSRAFNNLGLSAFLQQHYRQAKRYFTEALQVDPLNKKARQNLLLLNSVMEKQHQ
jgi:Flp pilus assembly protein TadD